MEKKQKKTKHYVLEWTKQRSKTDIIFFPEGSADLSIEVMLVTSSLPDTISKVAVKTILVYVKNVKNTRSISRRDVRAFADKTSIGGVFG